MKLTVVECHHVILSHRHAPAPNQSFWDGALLATLARKSAPLPQKWPIYYVNTDSLGHTENRENKTAGRQLVDFRKSRLWLTPAA